MREEPVALRELGLWRKAVAVCRVNRAQVKTAPAVSAAQRGSGASLLLNYWELCYYQGEQEVFFLQSCLIKDEPYE
jgi:hypothetical protein